MLGLSRLYTWFGEQYEFDLKSVIMKYSLKISKTHLCHVVTLDIADLVHGTVAGKGHGEVISSQKSSNIIHEAMNLKRKKILKISIQLMR